MEREKWEPAAPPLEHEELLARCMGNLDFVERVLSKFQDSFEEDLTRLEAGLISGDASQMADVAHRMKGASANTAAPRLHREAATIEQLARAGRIDELPHRLGRLQDEWTRFVDSLSSPDRVAVTDRQ